MTFRQTLLSMSAAAALIGVPALAFAQSGGASGGGSSMQSTTTQTAPQTGPVSSTPGAHAGATPGGTGSTQTAQGATGTRDAAGGVMAQSNTTTGNTSAPRDGTPGNPPGTAAGRAMDRTLGSNTTGTNPSGSSAASGTRDAHASTGLMPIESAALRNGRRASKMIGANLYNENNDSIGEVEDILMPMPTASTGGTAPTPVAIVSVGGFLGIGAKLVAVPYERLQWNGDRNRWTLSGATKESLTALPSFSYDGNERRG